MLTRSRAATIAIAIFCLFVSSLPSSGQDQPLAAQTRERTIAEQLIAKINALRQQRGLPPFAMSPLLNHAATIQSQDMATHNFFDHNNPVPGHRRPQDRVLAAGYPSTYIAENLFMSMGSGDEEIAPLCFQTWVESPGHLANMIDTARTQIGVGIAFNSQDETYVTAVFGRP